MLFLLRCLSLRALTFRLSSLILSKFKGLNRKTRISVLRLAGLTLLLQMAVECVLAESNSPSLSQSQAELVSHFLQQVGHGRDASVQEGILKVGSFSS